MNSSQLFLFVVSTTFAIMIHAISLYLQFTMPRRFMERRRSKAQSILNVVDSFQMISVPQIAQSGSKLDTKPVLCGGSKSSITGYSTKGSQQMNPAAWVPFERLLFLRKLSKEGPAEFSLLSDLHPLCVRVAFEPFI